MNIEFFLLICFAALVYQQEIEKEDTNDEEEDEEDENDSQCALVSGQHCDQNGICKYCAMCLQSSCVISKSENESCNATQSGIPQSYKWYDFCLSSGNATDGDYCATSTQCYQYQKSFGPSITYTWNNLTCDPFNCILVGKLPPSVPPASLTGHGPSNTTGKPHTQHDPLRSFHPPTAIAVIVFIIIGMLAISTTCFMKRCKRKKSANPSIPSSAPPSFSQAIRSSRPHSSTSSHSEVLPSYRSAISPPKYEHAIVTQIRGHSRDSLHGEHQPTPSIWIPVYFTNPSQFVHDANNNSTSSDMY
ncbi:hypothetical protein G6F46_007294 [Rhizopus delemar]|uniref:Uncharacterized protein n=2 Tax=Rhizopus TaxID=4842 RepID=A0A9P6Z172_9FUNG|nr:hypothetical protein G6F55_005923 [Rhizopus delemar]KAG1542662.1 hypothetical protein G6F51_007144 [Rhizopus arrhizus]KAG1496244.1 hypothetical protein G6F54_006606 [Rhizopus delemar]KAG1510027.1 hypothetical protein G6F53_006999 [Rhizopus delemar]KAG1518524.1 hypothetical protein G6F52_009004 [Rhizopus delemar]